MKKMMMFAPLLFVASLLAGTAVAQPRHSVPNYVRIQYRPPVATHACTINGVRYLVDQYESLWDPSGTVIVGRIRCGWNGCFAFFNDGEVFPTYGC